MRTNSRIYQSVAPEQNSALVKHILEDVAFKAYFPTERIIVTLSSLPSLALPNEDQEYFSGYQSTIMIAHACLHMALENENSESMSRMLLAQMTNSSISSIGEDFLDKGKMLILKDRSGKKLLSEIVELLKSYFSHKSFQEGTEDARSLFLAYWKELEKRGLNYTDLPTPPKR